MFQVVSEIKILSLPGLPKPVADSQTQEVPAAFENDACTTTSLIDDFLETKAFQDILVEISPLPISSNKDTKREKSVQVQKSKQITPRYSKEDSKTTKAKIELKSEKKREKEAKRLVTSSELKPLK
ncbi:hypothetical protein AVEN_235893-1 [Araneus ventricosus]|uniref:Uncharacterized protein n=1 Tax=Araneus ventricosus TaxID=182803 RepID=A0A4Y2UAM2_ARAVE|nr:hypothetical protein AVEN_235893-1 [Araneus ventricosus]